jgi:hypothetical protein
MDETQFDVRTLEHKLRRGVLSREQVDAHLNAIPDSAAESVETETRFVSTSTKTGALGDEHENDPHDLDG